MCVCAPVAQQLKQIVAPTNKVHSLSIDVSTPVYTLLFHFGYSTLESTQVFPGVPPAARPLHHQAQAVPLLTNCLGACGLPGYWARTETQSC